MRGFPESLRGYEERRIDEPEAVASELVRLFAELPEVERPVALGIYASCLRLMDKTEDCLLALEEGLRQARDVGNIWAEANLLQRRSNAEAARGDFELALKTGRQALALFMESEDRDRVGTTFFDQGMCQYHLGNYMRAIGLFHLALAHLGPGNLQNLFACHNGLALCYAETADFSLCESSADKARALAGQLGPMVAARFRWTEATLASKTKRYSLAESILRGVAEEYLGSGQGLEAALAIVELARTVLAQGKLEEAGRVARDARVSLMHLKEGSEAAAIVESVWRQADGISEAFLSQVSARLGACGALPAPQGKRS